jgi:cellulose synthase/poly-beta-1,6-N-acetylglucosamine synthase-like glycosyltransferase
VILVLATWLDLLQWITDAVGGVAVSSTIFFFGLMFVFFMLLHFSLRVSVLERTLTALVQEIGLQNARRRPLGGGAPEEDDEQATPAARVAVIVPCFNDGAFVTQAVRSVREEEPVEIVVVDDGSTDAATLGELGRLQAAGVRVVHQANGGPGSARTTGLRNVRAPFVYPLDADDELEPGALAAMSAELEEHPDAAFTWGDYVLTGADGGRYRSPDRWLPWTLTYVNPYPISSLFRRDALERLGGWSDSGYEDWDLWLQAVGEQLEGVRTDRVVYRRRLHEVARTLTADRSRHQELFAELQRRHARVFAARDVLRRQERPAAWKRAVYPVLFGARKVVPVRIEALMQQAMMRSGRGLPG